MWYLSLHTWLLIIISTSIHQSEESCEMLKKIVNLYRIERVLYRYVSCTQISPSDNLNTEILSTINSSCQYLEVMNSNLPEINKDMFYSLNLTQLTIQAGVQIVQEKTFERSNISTIILDNNSIKKIKDNAFKSFALYIITVQNNFLTEINARMLTGAANLRKLNFNNNTISMIESDAFKDLTSLEELRLSFNSLSSLNFDVFAPLLRILSIDLSNNMLRELKGEIFIKNKMLQYLNINNNQLAVLDASYFPSTLVEIKVEYNNLVSFNVSNLINLNTLDLDYNKISKLKNCLNNLPLLSLLHLNSNSLWKYVPFDINTFSGLSNLSIIELDSNQFKDFNFKAFKNINSLEGLSLVENYLTELDLSDLPADIKVLNLSQNYLVEVKNLSKFSTLLKLEISYNSLQEIDFNMFEGLTQLHSLWLNRNFISKLSLGCFRNLKLLFHLDLSYNEIKNISSGALNGLDSMAELDLSYNQLTYLNEDIFHNMKNLRYLSIAHNNLTSVNIKGILSHVIWLREIDMNGNNWTCKLLINISRDNKLLQLKSGNFYNVSNIYGIPCRESTEINENNHYVTYEQNIPDILSRLNDTVNYVHDISVKLSFIVALLVLFIIMVSAKIVVSKYSNQVTAATQFIYQKSESEPEIHLI